MKILLLSNQYPPDTLGGIGSYVHAIGRAMAARGHEVHVLTCNYNQEATDNIEQGVHVHRRGRLSIRGLGLLGIPLSAGRLTLALSNWLQARKLGVSFDVVEFPDWAAEGAVITALDKSTAHVMHLHTGVRTVARYNGWRLSPDIRLSDWAERFSLSRCHAITSPSRLLIHEMNETGWLGVSPEPALIRYPIDGSSASASDITHTEPIALFVGRLEQRKAPETLIEAAASIKEKVPEMRIIFLGRSGGTVQGQDYRTWAEALCKTRGIASEFPSHVPHAEVGDWYAKARVVVIPSRFDNFPMTALEAMAAGRPVVCSDRTGTAEIISGTGAGSVFATDDFNSLGKALLPYLTDVGVAEAAGDEARRLVQRECDPIRIAKQRELVYEEAVAAAMKA